MAAAEDQYFYEDEVYRINKRGHIEFGMVLENSELVSSDENSDREDGIRKGHIRVAWHPSGVEEVIHERKVGLADRSLMPGDVVRRMIKGKDTQRGYCRDIFVTACVQVVGTKQVIPDVPSEHLIPLEEFASDIAVCLDSWVGGIKLVHSNLHLLVPDGGAGSRCIINDLEANGLEEFDEKRDADSEFPHRNDYYPGQVLYGPLHCLEYANWTQCTKEMRALRNKPNKNAKVVVEGVETDSVGVQWQCRAYSKDGAGHDKEQPDFLVSGEDLKRLKLLNVFEPCTLQVGDRNFYTIRSGDTVIAKEVWRRNQRELFKPHQSERRRPPHKKSHTTSSPSCKEPSGDNTPKNLSRPPKPNQGMDIMSCQEKPVENVPPKSKEPLIDQGRKKRIIAEPKTSHSRQSATTETKLRTNPQSVPRRLAKSEAEVTAGAPPLEETDEAVVNSQKNHLVNSVLDDGDFEDVESSSDDESISSGCSSNGSHGVKKRSPALMTRVLKKKKLRRAKKRAPLVPLEPGTKVVVETLSTVSVADVVWQDGSIEKSIPSTQLYPIHHLDDQEFFPGDFVMENKDENGCMRVYGVIQSVEHAGRTARVKWFKTYTSSEQPQPTLLDEHEVSVYDLKDHPDFQYRPGTVVIRVANFEGEDANCTAGQVLDNYPEGKVRVWWADGHISMCWPQDLYKVGGYDSDEGELWEDNSSEASWETESEDTFVADEGVEENTNSYETLKPKLAANIEKARIAMSRLEEIFTQNPALQTTEVMRKLLEVYKDCRYLDKLMGTSFFNESHFQGLLERVRERGRANVAQRVADQVSRLFQPQPGDSTPALEVAPIRDPVLETLPELRIAIQQISEQAEQMSELVQSQCNAAVQQKPAAEKTPEPSSTIKVFQQIHQLFQKSLFRIGSSSNSSADKDVCNNEKKEDGKVSAGKKSEDKRTNGRVLGEVKFNPGDFADCDPTKSYVLRLRFAQPEADVVTPRQDSAGTTAMSPVAPPTPDDSGELLELEPELESPEPKRGEREGNVCDPIFASGEFLTESLAMLERRVSAAAVCAMTSGPTRKLARRMPSILGKFGSVTCELVSGDEVVFSMDLCTGSGSRSRQTQVPSSFASPPSPQPPTSPPTPTTTRVCSTPTSTSTSTATAPVPASPGATVSSNDPVAACSNSAVCVRLCSLIKAQLVKAHSEVTRRFGGTQLNMTLSDAANSLSPNSNKDEGTNEAEAADTNPVPSTAIVETTTERVEAPKESPAVVPVLPDEEPSTPLVPSDEDGSFAIEDSAPNSHKFKLTIFQPADHQNFYRTVRKEIKLLRSALPSGIWVKGFEDRMDLYSVMIRGPEKTPYEDGLFFFDFQMSANYPNEPPLCHYISYCSDRLNPNLYEDGKVCVSLLGTWSGKGTEVWTAGSNLLQVIVSIQGLILVSEPYFNEAGYEKQKGSQQGRENSRMYNEMVVLKLVQAMSKLVQHPPPAFQEEIKQHFQKHAQRFSNRLESWLDVSERYNNNHPLSPTTPTSFREMTQHDIVLPEFPLIPASKGFCLTLRKTLVTFREVMQSIGINTGSSKLRSSQSEEN